MYGEKLEQELREYFSTEIIKIEPSLEWWDRTISNVTGQTKSSRWYGFTPQTRLAWVLLPLLLVLLIGGTVYAASPVMREFFQKFAGHIENKGLVQELNISQTIDGVTISIQRAYADSNVILLGTMVSGPAKDYDMFIGDLSTDDGYIFPGMLAVSTVPGSEDILGEWAEGERRAVISSYDASKLEGAAAEIHLKLKIDVEERTALGEESRTMGPFVLSFTLPFNSGKAIEVNQTVEANGIPITLQKVVISPWVTQVAIQFKETNHPAPIISLELPTGNQDSKNFLSTQSGEYFLGDYTNEHGEGTVIISELVSKPGPGNENNRIFGPWIFHFNVP